jgi:hypothetical protein
MPRIRPGRAALAGLLGALAVCAPAAAATDYTLSIDPTRRGPAIADTMYGVFFEDINRAADGGLYAELVQNRSTTARSGCSRTTTATTPTTAPAPRCSSASTPRSGTASSTRSPRRRT